MKVYLLTALHDERNSEEIIDVFDKPKTARKWLDTVNGWDTKNKWVRDLQDGSRSIRRGKVVYTLREFKVQAKKTKDEND